MIISAHAPQLKNNKISRIHGNTLLLPHSGKYFGKESFKKGFYSRHLIGLFALSIAINLGFKEIYLLGYDCCEINGQTHFYQGVADLNAHTDLYIKGQLKHKRFEFFGVGKDPKGKYKTSTYNKPDLINKKWFKPFMIEKDVKIFNVSPDSVLTLFPKLTYEEFYKKIDTNIIQSEVRKDVWTFISQQLIQ